jgi:sRNA-binding protein
MTKNQSIISTTIVLLAQKFPAAIQVFERRRRPLAIGVFEVICAALPDVDSKAIKIALRSYCMNICYLRACTKHDAVRINLDGEPVGPVSQDDVAHAFAAIAGIAAKRAKTAAASAAHASAGSTSVQVAKKTQPHPRPRLRSRRRHLQP